VAAGSAIDWPLRIVGERQHAVSKKPAAVEKTEPAAEVSLFVAQTDLRNTRAETHFAKTYQNRRSQLGSDANAILGFELSGLGMDARLAGRPGSNQPEHRFSFFH